MVSIEKPRDRIFLTLDSYEYIDLLTIRQDFKGLVHGVKLGIRFLRSPQTARTRESLRAEGFALFLDAKLEEAASQMPDTVRDYDQDGYRYFSISGAVETESMVTAADAAQGSRPVVALARHQSHLLDDQLRKIEEANQLVAPGNELTELLVDVNDLERVRGACPRFCITATGIYVPGLPHPDESRRMTPSEALATGADRIAVGSAVLSAGHERHMAMERVLADCA